MLTERSIGFEKPENTLQDEDNYNPEGGIKSNEEEMNVNITKFLLLEYRQMHFHMSYKTNKKLMKNYQIYGLK